MAISFVLLAGFVIFVIIFIEHPVLRSLRIVEFAALDSPEKDQPNGRADAQGEEDQGDGR